MKIFYIVSKNNLTFSFKFNYMTILTGSAGFIGFNLASKLLEQGIKVIGLDNLNNYYDPKLNNQIK